MHACRSTLEDPTGTGKETVLTGLKSPNSIALDIPHGHVYWIDTYPVAERRIGRANLDGTGVVTLLTPMPGQNANNLSLDIAGGKMYWLEGQPTEGVYRANLDGTGKEKVIDPPSNSRGSQGDPFGLALDLVNQKLYWGENYPNEVIHRTNLDGSGGEAVFSGIAGFDLALDVARGKLYWSTRDGFAISRGNTDGTNAESLNLVGRAMALDLSPAPRATTTTLVCDAGPLTYTGSPIEPCTATVTGEGGLSETLTVTYSNNVNAGTARARANYAGAATYAASSASALFTIGKAASTTVVTFESGPYVYRGTPFTATARVTGPGGLDQTVTPVTYGGDCTNVVSANWCSASASYAGDVNHEASNGTRSITITKAASAIVVSCPTEVIYTGSPLQPCTAAAAGPGLNLPVAVTYSNNVSSGKATASGSYPGDANHNGSSGAATFIIRPRDALVRYIGQLNWMASGASSTTPQVTLSASVQDPTGSALAGATMDFIDAATNTVLASGVPVSLVAGAPGTGTANAIATVNGKPQGVSSYLILVKMTGNYTNAGQAVADKTALVMKAANTNDATGEGTISPSAAAGTLRSDIGAAAAFAIDMKGNKSGNNLQGKITVAIPMSDGIVYVKSNAVSSMVADAANATIYAKASVSKVTKNGSTVAIDGGATLRVDIADGPDQLAFTVLSSKNSELLYSNNWRLDSATNSWRTALQGIASGSVTIK